MSGAGRGWMTGRRGEQVRVKPIEIDRTDRVLAGAIGRERRADARGAPAGELRFPGGRAPYAGPAMAIRPRLEGPKEHV
jgi:hypothetical protein